MSIARILLLGLIDWGPVMPRKLQVVDSKRKTPRQMRARATVELIFEATARILQRGGWAAPNTNAVTEQAGISIGTLYQYFSYKESMTMCGVFSPDTSARTVPSSARESGATGVRHAWSTASGDVWRSAC
jgi:Bacterial regulatory proteins, tetR family